MDVKGVPCNYPGPISRCKAQVPSELDSAGLCVLHFTQSVEQNCAELHRQIALRGATQERQAAVAIYIVECASRLANISSNLSLSDDLKRRILSTFLSLMNLRDKIARSASYPEPRVPSGGRPGASRRGKLAALPPNPALHRSFKDDRPLLCHRFLQAGKQISHASAHLPCNMRPGYQRSWPPELLPLGKTCDLNLWMDSRRAMVFKAILGAATKLKFAANFAIIRQGEPARRMFLLMEGGARFSYLSPEGQKLLGPLILPGEVFGGAAIVLKPSCYLATTETAKDSRVLAWDRTTIRPGGEVSKAHGQRTLDRIRLSRLPLSPTSAGLAAPGCGWPRLSSI